MVVTCGIYLYNTHNKKILVCHATNSPWNRWSIPKGLKEDEEDLLEVATRELFEETAIDLNGLQVLKIVPLPPVKYQKQNKILESFLGITDSDLEGHMFRSNIVEKHVIPEVDSWKWVGIADLNKWIHESQQKNLPTISNLVQC